MMKHEPDLQDEPNSNKRCFIIPEVAEIDITELDNVFTCSCSADDDNPH